MNVLAEASNMMSGKSEGCENSLEFYIPMRFSCYMIYKIQTASFLLNAITVKIQGKSSKPELN